MSKPKFKLYPLFSFQESVEEFEGLEDGRNHLLYRVFFWIGTAFIATFLVINIRAERIELVIPLAISLVVVLMINVYLVKTSNLKITGYLYAISLIFLIWFVVWHGGVKQTGPLWIFPITVIVISLLGFVHGLLFVVVSWLGAALVLLLEIPIAPQVEYTDEYKTRLLATWFALGGLTWGIEFSRAKAYRHMRDFNARVEQASLMDPLTNVLNRRGLEELYQSEESRFQRTGEDFSLLMIDVDNFKAINDKHGHRIGDEILRHISLIMRDHIRGMDVLGRWGGEEFIVLLSRTNADDASEVAEKLRAAIEEYRGFPFHENAALTISIGVTGYREASSLEQLVELADRAMYSAKRAGKNRVERI